MKLDLQDGLLLAGVAALVYGVSLWSVPAAWISLGVLCLVGVYQIERAKRLQKGVKHGSAVE